MQSGYLLLKEMLRSEACTDGPLAIMRKVEFDAKCFLTMDMPYVDYITATNEMLALHLLLQEEDRPGKQADMRMLLDKMPEAMSKHTKRIRNELKESAAMGETPKYNYMKLVQKLSVYITGADDDVAHLSQVTGTVCAARALDGSRDTRGARVGGDREQRPRPCLNCGSLEHGTTERGADGELKCKAKCATCKFWMCPGIHGKYGPCVVAMDEMPAREDVKNFLGQVVPDFVYGKLKSFHETYHSRNPSVCSIHFAGNAIAGGFNMR
jgi:hypothetical protein